MSDITSKRVVEVRSNLARRKALLALAVASVAAGGAFSHSASAATRIWTGTSSVTWTDAADWVGGAPANDIVPDSAQFDQAAYTNQPTITAATNVAGLIFGDPSGQVQDTTGALAGAGTSAAITITATGQTLGLGAGGIVMNANSGPVTITADTLMMWTTQTWSNASSSALTITAAVNRFSGLSERFGVLNITNTGSGSVTVSSFANGATGIIAPWVSFTNGSGTYYATVTGDGSVGAFAGTAASDVTATTLASATTNYDLNITGSNTVTGASVANTIRYVGGGGGTIQINGTGTLTTNGLLNASGGNLTVAAGPGPSGGLVMGSGFETDILSQTGNIDVTAAIINPSTNNNGGGSPHRYWLTVGGGPHTVFVNNIVNNSSNGSDLVVGANNGPTESLNANTALNQLMIGSTKNLTLNAANGSIFIGPAIFDSQGGGDNDAGGPGDTGITESVLGSTVTIAGTHLVSFSASSTFTGGLILEPGANIYVNNWVGTGTVLGTGPITFMGNNSMSKYLNTFTNGYNNRINLDGDLQFVGSPPGNQHPWGYGGSSVYDMRLVNDGTAGTGEVHSGANVTVTVNVPDPVAPYGTGLDIINTVYLGGLFDDGHGYGFTKDGLGNVFILGSDGFGDTQSANFTGPITVLQGRLQTGEFGPSAGRITSRDNVVFVDTGATFYNNNGGQTIAGLNDGPHGGGTAGGNVLTTLAGSGTYTFSGGISGARSIAKDGSGTQNLSGLNTYTGTTTIAGGTLNLDFSGPVASAATNPGQDVLYNGIVAGPLALSGGKLSLTGAAAAANVQHVSAISTSGGSAINLNLHGATSLLLSTGNITRSGGGALNITLPSGAQSATNGILTTASNVNGIMGGFATVNGAAAGSADWAVSGATHVPAAAAYDPTDATAGQFDDLAGSTLFIVYTGATLLAPGTPVSFNFTTGTLPTGVSAGTLYYVASNGTFGTQNYATVATTPTGTPIGNQTALTGTLSVDIQGQLTALPAGGYTAFVGTGDAATTNLLISGNASLTATETVNSLKINPSAAGQSLNLGANQLVIDAVLPNTTSHVGGLLFTGTNDYTIQGTGLGLSANGGSLTINQFSTGTLTISAVISDGTGATTLTKAGSGKLVLTGTNTFTGGVNLNGGVVEINTLQALGNGASLNVNGSTIRYASGFSGGGDITTTPGGGTTAGRAVTIGGNGLTVDVADAATNITFANAYGFQNGIIGTGGLTKTGLGTLTLDNNYVAGQSNGYTGPTVISGGTLAIGPDALIVNGGAANQIATAGTNPAYNSAIGKSSYAAANLVLDGGTLQYLGAATSTDHNFTLTQNSGTIDSSNASNAALVFSNTSSIAATGSGARTLTLTGSSTGGNTLALGIPNGTGGATSVVKSGTGTWLLNGTSTYTGNTTVNSGTLGGSGTLASTVVAGSSAHTIAPSATLASTAATKLTVGGLTTGSNTTLDLNLVTPNTAGGSDQIAVTGALNISGGGKLAFTHHGLGQPSLGYYKIMSYGSLTGTASNLTLPAIANNISYVLDLNKDPGFVDVHRGFQGDANDDGTVNIVDLGTLATHYNGTGASWSQGDFNGDGVVNIVDLGILATYYNQGVGAFEVGSASAPASGVPEPASLLLLGAGLVGVLSTRRRVRKS